MNDDVFRGLSRDDVEGRYTQADPAGPASRSVAGRYTGADPSMVGSYVGRTQPARLRHGNYPRADHGVATRHARAA